jgi:hypothetical protein
MGVMYQIYIIASQNAVPPSQIGVVTGQLNFFRSMGGSFAVAGLGALLTDRLGVELVKQLGRAGERIDPNDVVRSGTSHVRGRQAEGVQTALSNSVHDVFLVCVPIAVIGLILAFMLPEKPLRKYTGQTQPEPQPEQAREQQEPEPEEAVR